MASNYSGYDNTSQISRNSMGFGQGRNSLSHHGSIDRIEMKNADKTMLKQKKLRP
jgi:hypothetical protein